MEEKEEPKENNKKEEKLTKEEIKRQKKEQKEAKKREEKAKKEEEKAKKEEEKRLKKEKKAKEKEMRQSLSKSMRLSKLSGHMKLKSSGQILPSNMHHHFDLIIKDELPDSFFEELLINEMELSEEFTIEKLTHLIKLYSKAMEHYLQTDLSKVKDYQGRMEFLLTNKDTLKKLKKQSENLSVIKNKNDNKESENLKKSMKGGNLKNDRKINIEYATDNLELDDIINKVNEVIGDSNAKGDIQATKNLIEKDLEKQNLSWKEKLKKKKKGSLRSSMMNLGTKKLGLNLSKNRNLNMKSSTDEKLDLGGKKLEKMKFIFNEDIYEDIKEENEGEGSDKENTDKNEKKDQIIDKPEDLNIINNDDNDNKKEEKIEKIEDKNIINDNENDNLKGKNVNVDDNKEKNEKEQKIENCQGRKSIVDKDVTRNVDIDEKILTSVNQKMDLLMTLIEDIEKNKLNEDEDDDNLNNEDKKAINNDNNNEIITEEKKENNILSEFQTNAINVPVKFQSTYYEVESVMQSYMDEFNNFYYKAIFDQFSSSLKEIYDNKYKKYIDISVEYHTQIKEKEHILENDENLSEEKKTEIQQIIDSLKDEQQNQIAKIEDEFNRLIVSKVNEFKLNSFKNNSGIQLMEEQLKLDIYSLINESFY